MDHIVEIKSLRKAYPEFILDDISLNIPQGYITGIIGPNGAGKTTTIKLIMNLIKANAGEIKIFDKIHNLDSKEIKNRIGYVGEEQYFYDFHSAGWTGKFVSHFYKYWDSAAYDRLLENFSIPPQKSIKKYSKGMKVKLALAVALAHQPELIILDEPTAGLDPVIRREVLDHLQKLTSETGIPVIISSHITDDITRIADYITYMNNGRIILFTAKDILLSHWKKIHFKKDSLGQKLITSLANVEDHVFGSSGITKDYPNIQNQLEPGLASGNIKVENVDLDDILILLVKGF